MEQRSGLPPFTPTLPDLPGWELRAGGSRLRGRWWFRQQPTAAIFAWAVLMRCMRHEVFPNLIFWGSALTVEFSDLKKPGRTEKAGALAADLSTITGPPQPKPIEQPSPFLSDLTRAIRAELIVRQLMDYLDARDPK